MQGHLTWKKKIKNLEERESDEKQKEKNNKKKEKEKKRGISIFKVHRWRKQKNKIKMVFIPFIEVCRWNSRRLWILCRWNSRRLWINHAFCICWVLSSIWVGIKYFVYILLNYDFKICWMLSCIWVGIKCLLKGSCNILGGKCLFKQGI